ncbi:DUF6233 domain-containing protein [Streptomyces sp. NRRL S-1022]|uniref:DUF6233 domain-containing protein n=1 Tax=Streptomyces sp. NRRL S-1022 TaxID=1463880 RepID=UPI003B63660C
MKSGRCRPVIRQQAIDALRRQVAPCVHCHPEAKLELAAGRPRMSQATARAPGEAGRPKGDARDKWRGAQPQLAGPHRARRNARRIGTASLRPLAATRDSGPVRRANGARNRRDAAVAAQQSPVCTASTFVLLRPYRISHSGSGGRRCSPWWRSASLRSSSAIHRSIRARDAAVCWITTRRGGRIGAVPAKAIRSRIRL